MATITDKEFPQNLARDVRRAWRLYSKRIRIYDMPEDVFNDDKQFGEINQIS